MRFVPILTLLLAAAPTAAGPAFASSTAAEPGALSFSPCTLEHPLGVAAVSAECGTLRVPENPDDPAGRHIDLQVARVQAISRRKSADPLFVLAGGPGMAATVFYTSIAPAFRQIRRDRDIILVDQRGTGRSNPLTCELSNDVLFQATDAVIAAETKRCLTSLQTRADVSAYTTSLAVRDLDAVRASLGYSQVNLYGASYGTRVAQHYLRRFPKHTRTLILDGVVPPQLILGPAIALDAESALQNILARCSDDAPCRERFGDPVETYLALREELERASVPVSLPDPTTGNAWQFPFTSMHLATVLRLASYTSEQAALLPLALDLAQRAGNFTPLAAQFLLVSRSLDEQLAYGMHNTVVCTEDVPFYEEDDIDRDALDRTYIGTTQLDALQNLCKLWPRGPIDGDFHEPLISEVPVLLLSGGADPVTPPAYAEQARRGFGNSLHVVLPDLGHGQLAAPCIDHVMAEFVEHASVDGLDVSCTRDIVPMPFFTSLAGPPP